MRKIKNTKDKMKNEITENTLSLRTLIMIFGIILVVFLVFYLLTIVILDKTKEKYEFNNPGLQVDENDISINGIFKQEEDLYYVLAINDEFSETYEIYTSSLENLYNINLDDALNKTIISDEMVIDEDPKNIKINDTTLFVIENKTLKEYHVGKENVLTYLRNLSVEKNLES